MAHGEANYALFSGVMNWYGKSGSPGAVAELKEQLAGILGCDEERVFEEIDLLLGHLIQKKSLREYGADEKMIKDWSRSVLDTQQRLLKNSPVPLGYEDIWKIYEGIL